MACDIANGRALECKESIGGIRNVYFANNGAGGALTIDADGDLTGLGTSSSDVYKYELIPQGSSFDEVVTVSEENGTGHSTHLEISDNQLNQEDKSRKTIKKTNHQKIL